MIARLFISAALLLPSVTALAQPVSEWLDGLFQGDPAGLFAGEPRNIVAFVQAHDDLAKSALLYIRPCIGDETDFVCHLNQQRFVLDYIASFYGDHGAQENMVYDLAGDGMPPRQIGEGDLQVGVAADPIWACAWRVAILTSGNPQTDIGDLFSYKTDCESIPADDENEAEGIAIDTLTPKIRALSATPAIDFTLIDNYPNSN